MISTVEKAQYKPQGHEVNPIGVGPAPLALKEMMKVDDDRARYRSITMRDHFTTKGTNPLPSKPTGAHGPSRCDSDSVACHQDHPVAKLAGSSAAMVAYIQHTPRGFAPLHEKAPKLYCSHEGQGGILSKPTHTNSPHGGHPRWRVGGDDRDVCGDQISDNSG